MNTYREEIGNKLNVLLEKNYEAEKGFKKAAEHTDNKFLKGYFERKSKEKYVFGHELKTEIISYGQDVEKKDSITAKAHRTWIDVKVLFSSDSEEAILEETVRGEKFAIKEYAEVLEELTLPPSTAVILKKQKSAIELGLTNMKTLEDLA